MHLRYIAVLTLVVAHAVAIVLGPFLPGWCLLLAVWGGFWRAITAGFAGTLRSRVRLL